MYPYVRFQVEAEFISDGRVLVKVKLTGRYTVQVRNTSDRVTSHSSASEIITVLRCCLRSTVCCGSARPLTESFVTSHLELRDCGWQRLVAIVAVLETAERSSVVT